MLQQYSFMSKVCLLVLHFPKLRILWSKSLHATAEMFRDFKSNQDEPEAEVAASIGEAALCSQQPALST